MDKQLNRFIKNVKNGSIYNEKFIRKEKEYKASRKNTKMNKFNGVEIDKENYKNGKKVHNKVTLVDKKEKLERKYYKKIKLTKEQKEKIRMDNDFIIGRFKFLSYLLNSYNFNNIMSVKLFIFLLILFLKKYLFYYLYFEGLSIAKNNKYCDKDLLSKELIPENSLKLANDTSNVQNKSFVSSQNPFGSVNFSLETIHKNESKKNFFNSFKILITDLISKRINYNYNTDEIFFKNKVINYIKIIFLKIIIDFIFNILKYNIITKFCENAKLEILKIFLKKNTNTSHYFITEISNTHVDNLVNTFNILYIEIPKNLFMIFWITNHIIFFKKLFKFFFVFRKIFAVAFLIFNFVFFTFFYNKILKIIKVEKTFELLRISNNFISNWSILKCHKLIYWNQCKIKIVRNRFYFFLVEILGIIYHFIISLIIIILFYLSLIDDRSPKLNATLIEEYSFLLVSSFGLVKNLISFENIRTMIYVDDIKYLL